MQAEYTGITEQAFHNPPVDWRPVVFWSWNGELKAEHLLRQIGQMKDAGIGGFFMHARRGLTTPYMQDDWFRMIGVCVDEAKRLGMKAWIYDEQGWPSGYAGGIVPRLGHAFRARALVMKRDSVPEDDEFRLIAAHESDESVYFYEWTAPLGNARYEGASYVDLLNPDVTEAFIESTHQVYEQLFGEQFGETIPGVFSDEACVLMWEDREEAMLPWTSDLERLFREAYGYELAPQLHSLVFAEGNYRTVRHDYWKLVTGLLTRHYSRTVHKWCEERGLAYTGHYMGEDYMWKTMRFLGDTMPHYEHMHIPGVDCLGKQLHKTEMEYCQNGATVMAVKQATSVAHQLGKPRVLSELYGGAGQDYDLRHQKWMLDWHLVHGVNLFTPHLLPYTVIGQGKRDWPPMLGPQQPWWPHYSLLNDYQSRVGYALSQGSRRTKLLVLHPMETAWEVYSPVNIEGVEALDQKLGALCLELLDAHVDFDFGNEQLMERYGRTAQGKLEVGGCAYSGVVIPGGCRRLRPHTLRLLEEFSRYGGKIWSYDPVSDIRSSIRELDGIAVETFDIGELSAAVGSALVISGAGSGHIWLHERADGNTGIRFMVNLSLTRTINVRLSEAGRLAYSHLNGETGGIERLATEEAEGRTELDWTFAPGESLLLVSEPLKPFAPAVLRPHRGMGGAMAAEERPIQFQLTKAGANTLVLDRCALFDPDLREWGEERQMSALRRENKRHAGVIRTTVALSGNMPSGNLIVAAEPGIVALRWNGSRLSETVYEWLDPEFIYYDVPAGVLRPGDNELAYELESGACSALENLYIHGSFEVEANDGRTAFALRKQSLGNSTDVSVKAANGCDFATDGYPFFAGTLTVSAVLQWDAARDGKRCLLTLEQPQAAAISAFANGRAVGAKAWGPWEWDLTDCLVPGTNIIELELANTLRNLMGPHHTPGDERLQYLRPAAYDDESSAYYVRPFGIGNAAITIIPEPASSDRRGDPNVQS